MSGSRTFAATGDTTAEGHPIYRAVGPVRGRFTASYRWIDRRMYGMTAVGWVLAISTVDDHGLEVNRVRYRGDVDLLAEPAKGCDDQPGSSVSWYVHKQGGTSEVTPAARTTLTELFTTVLAEVHTSNALRQAKIHRCQEQIAALEEERAKFLATNDQALDAAARLLSFHLDNPE